MTKAEKALKYYYENKEKCLKRINDYNNKNKKEIAKQKKEYYKNNPDKARVHWLKNKYGLTPEKYKKIFDNQHGCCAICGRHQTEFKKVFVVDHDHQTGKIRGLLCYGCNLGLGGFDDNRDSLLSAISYLDENN